MRILSIAAVTLLSSGLSAATAQQHELLGNTKPPTQKQKDPSNLQRSTPTTKVVSRAHLLGTPTAPPNQSVVSGGSELCAAATPIAGPGPFVGDNIGATTDGPNNCGAMAEDVWYNYTAGATGLHAFVMCGSGYDTVINVYDTAACPPGPSLGCNDDACGLQSTVSVALTSGLVYKVQIGGFGGANGTYTLSVTPPGPGCPCAGAPPEGEGPPCGIPVDTFNGGCNSTPFVYSAIAVGGTVCGTGAFDGATRDTDWYQFTLVAPTTVTWTVTAEFPTLIAILDNLCPPTLIDFDFGATCGPVSSTAALGAGTYVLFVANDFSTIVPCAGPGNSYLGALTGGGGGCPGPANNCCATPTTVVGNGPFPWTNVGATTDGPAAPCAPLTSDVWYTWNATCTGIATFSLCVGGLTPDTVIDVRAGAPCPGGAAIGCDDDTCSSPAFGTSQCTFPCTAGLDYTLRIGSFGGGATGSGMFEVLCTPTNPPGPCDVLDDGVTETAVGFNDPVPDLLWMHSQGDVGITTVVKSISTAWGTPLFGGNNAPPDGSPARVGLWSDPNGDGNPTDAVLLQEVNTSIVNHDTDILQVVNLSPSVLVTGKYFIGASCTGGTFQAPLDTTTAPGAGLVWICGSTIGALDYNNLAGEEFPPTDEDFIAPGHWLLRGDCKDIDITEMCGVVAAGDCPCGNDGSVGNGCANSSAPGGAHLAGSGNSIISADTVDVVASDIRKGNPTLALFFSGSETASNPVNDGLLCAGAPICRLWIWKIAGPGGGVITLNGPGATTIPPNVGIAQRSADLGRPIQNSETRVYTTWYRDPPVFGCAYPAVSNYTNGLRILWSQ